MKAQIHKEKKLASEIRKESGAHYTPPSLADFVAQQIIDAAITQLPLETLKILDPSVGDGELLISLLHKIPANKYKKVAVNGFDTDKSAIEIAANRIRNSFPQYTVNMKHEDFIDVSLEYRNKNSYPLLFSPQKFDLIIANPPYVRTQILGAAQARFLAHNFGLTGRVDLYHVFIQGIAAMLGVNGIAGIIVSNRFMTTKSGTEIRESIKREFEILHIWDLGDTRLFEAAVLPAVLLLRKKTAGTRISTPKFMTIYSTNKAPSTQFCEDVISALDKEGIVSVKGSGSYLIQHGVLESDKHRNTVWRIATATSDKWLSTVRAHTFCTFGEIGKIRVGVKTTADKVFIRSDWNSLPDSERPELLKPLITHHIARRYKSYAITKNILYTHQIIDGKRVAVNLKHHPRAAKYLNNHKSILESRQYIRQSGRNWFEIWVPQNPESWSKPKIVFRDITETPTFWMDLDGAVVNGDCYWLTNDFKSDENLLWLCLAVGNSSFIEVFYDNCFNNKLYAGRRRFMTQYVEKFPIPDPNTTVAKEIIKKTKSLYTILSSNSDENLEKEIDLLVWQSFGLCLEEVSR